MRAVAAAALVSLAFVIAGCGGTTRSVVQAGGIAGEAATLVPSDAKAFVAVDTDLNSTQWQHVDALTKTLPIRAKLIDELNTKLQSKGLTWKDDVAPALGPELDVAVVGTAPIVFTQPSNESKLEALATKLSKADEQYTVQQIGGWSVVADSPKVFDRVRSAQSGKSLADTPAFQAAWSSVAGAGVARAFVNGATSTDWLAARISADTDAVRVEAALHPRGTLPALAPRSLLGDVPSGAGLAIAFRGTGDLLQRLPAAKLPLKELAPLLAGGGVLYARPAGLLPEVALELAPKDPQAALASARTLLHSLAGKLGPLQLTAQLSDGKLVIADSPAAVTALRTGPKLVDDAAFKDATHKAGVPTQTSFVAYADVPQLAPFIPVLLQGITGKAPDSSLGDNLAHVGPVVAWGTRDGGLIQLHLWLQPR